ncbi:putative pseudouridine synthase TruD [Trypanosoma vivax]|nr:hypothetical protein TRVL_04526 [Trypanosoma vivax]KAH8611440.1 putative pseudouridine synthase TruD [Trypanosoma vivax]
MRFTHACRRRLILGMSIEDAQSKFDSPESRAALRLAHERHNQGLYHELQLAQRLRNRLPGERKCHLVRHAKPTVKGFQAYIKSSPGDYVVREIWRDKREDAPKLQDSENIKSAELPAGGSGIAGTGATHYVGESGSALDFMLPDTTVTDGINGAGIVEGKEDQQWVGAAGQCVDSNSVPGQAMIKGMESRSLQSMHVGQQVVQEASAYSEHRTVMIHELTRVAKTLAEETRKQLLMRRETSTLPTTRSVSVVDRLVDDVHEAEEKGYTSLSSSSHILEPLGLSLKVCNKRDKRILEAFNSVHLCLPAEENDISISLWVAGAIISDAELAGDFPYYIAKHAEPELGDDDVSSQSIRVPAANIDIYFSPELYKLEEAVGIDGVMALRRFIGRTMTRQHDPLPTASSIVLNMRRSEQEASGLHTGESTQIPWSHVIQARVASLSGTVLEVSSEETPPTEVMREAIRLVWRTWGNLVKDLHVHGDLDYLYVSVRPKVEDKAATPLSEGLRGNKRSGAESPAVAGGGGPPQEKGVPFIRDIRSTMDELVGTTSTVWEGFKPRKSQAKNVLLPADFVVVECLLEKRGLPHRMVVEDIVENLTELQRQAMEAQRLATLNELQRQRDHIKGARGVQEKRGSGAVRPVMYAPRITVSHAGVIEAAAHSFQRIRIRGSCLAHVEALAQVLSTGEHFIDREGISLQQNASVDGLNSQLLSIPLNLSFSNTHAEGASSGTTGRLVGHRVPQSYVETVSQRMGTGHFRTYQRLRPKQYMVANKEEREFWCEHYYKLSDIQLVFHDRISPVDIEDTSRWSSMLKSQLLSTRNGHDSHTNEVDEADDKLADADRQPTGRGRKPRKQKDKSKRTLSAHFSDLVSTTNPEKLFEYLCVDMEVRSATYDLRVGDNDGYAYNVKLRRIPENHISLVKPAMASLEEHGFINYFGPQRFAPYTRYNMHPGLHLLKGEFRAAANVIVQQFYMDADLAAEKRRNGQAIAKMYSLKGVGFHLPDTARTLNDGQSIAEHGSALQSVLSNALQATAIVNGDDDADEYGDRENASRYQPFQKVGRRKCGGGNASALSAEGPCAEAFLRVVGPNACSMLVHEFLAFIWNSIVNQRLQRYGTFAILPGDLVRSNPLASPHSIEYGRATYASRRDIEKGKYTCYDVVLPVPGVGVVLPDNHTADLYIVTLKRMGILYNPETRQWDIFKSRRCDGGGGMFPGGGIGDAPFSSSYKRFSTSFALMEEELGCSNSVVQTADYTQNENSACDIASAGAGAVPDASHLRRDLRQGEAPGNPLGVSIMGSYRHVLINPSSQLSWRMHVKRAGDPYQRWAFGVRRSFAQNNVVNTGIVDTITCDPDEGGSKNDLQLPQKELLFGSAMQDRPVGGGTNATQRQPRSAPPYPYWLPQKSDGCLELTFELPFSVYPSMLLREITKSDVNSPEIVDLDRPLIDTRAKSWNTLSVDKQQLYRRHFAKKREKLFASAPRAINVALLHQHIFRSGGMRRSLLPSMRGYDNVSK